MRSGWKESVGMIDPRPELAAMTLYSPGMSLGQARAHSGREAVVKLASNESLWGPSPEAMKAASRALSEAQYYPLVQQEELLRALAEMSSLDPGQIVVGNGADEVLRLVAQAYVRPHDEVIYPSPSFSAYRHCVLLTGATPVPVDLDQRGANNLEAMLERVTARTRLIYLCSPNNPTGTPFSRADWDAFIDRVPDHVLVVVDGAYYEFCREPQPDYAAAVRQGRPVVWVRTFSKLYALAALRVGWAAAPEAVAQQLFKVRDPFSVNGVGWAAALASLNDRAYFDQVLTETLAARDHLVEGMQSLGLPSYETETNFVTFKVPGDGTKFGDELLARGFVVRPTIAFGLSGYVRVTVAPLPILDKFLAALRKLG